MQRDYWYSVARTLSKLDAPEKVGTHRRRTHHPPPRRAQSQDRQSPHRLRSHGLDFDPRAHFRRHQRRLRLPRRHFPRRQARPENRRRQRHRHRRRHHPRRIRHQPLRRRRHPHAPHRGHRKRRAEVVPAEHLHREKTRPADHSQRLARTGRHSRHRPRKLFSRSRARSLRKI